MLAAGTPGIDLDIRDWAINRAIITELLDVVLGAGPVRVGAFPKVLLPCYAETPFAKVATRWFALAGEDFTAESYQPHRVEVLGQGQQWVAFAIHPGTQRPYGWFRGSILDRPAHDLPHLDHATAIKLCNAAEHVLLRCGATPLQRCGAAWVEDKPATVNVPRQWVAGPTDGSWQRLGAEVIAKRVDHRAYSSPGGWRLKCPVHRGESNNSLVIDDAEQPGRVIFHCFAGCAWLDVARRLDELCR